MTSFAALNYYETAYPGTLVTVADQARATAALDAVCASIRRYCSQRFDYVESDVITVSGTGKQALLLPELPVVAVNSVTINKDETSELAVTDYRLLDPDAGLLWRPTAVWPWGGVNITVDYDHGYADIPADLIEVAVHLAHESVTAIPSQLRSETIGGYSYTRDAGQTTVHDFAHVLELYRAKRIPVA